MPVLVHQQLVMRMELISQWLQIFKSAVCVRMPDSLQQPWHCLQEKPASLLGMATSAEDARVMLEALEAGTSGVVLKTEDPLQVPSHVPWRAYTPCQTLILSACMRVLNQISPDPSRIREHGTGAIQLEATCTQRLWHTCTRHG